jgi:hypothetical protein
LFVRFWLTLEALNMVQPKLNASGSHAIFGATRPFLTKTSTNEKITIRVEALGTPSPRRLTIRARKQAGCGGGAEPVRGRRRDSNARGADGPRRLHH